MTPNTKRQLIDVGLLAGLCAVGAFMHPYEALMIPVAFLTGHFRAWGERQE